MDRQATRKTAERDPLLIGGADKKTAPADPGQVVLGNGQFVEQPTPEKGADVTGDGDVELNFSEANVREVAQTVLGTVLGQNVVVDASTLEMHLSSLRPDGRWVVEMRALEGHTTRPYRDVLGMRLDLPGHGSATLDEPYPITRTRERVRHRRDSGWRPWICQTHCMPTWNVTAAPIRYSYVTHDWPSEYYQTVYATEPGSAEMPSAGRAFRLNSSPGSSRRASVSRRCSCIREWPAWKITNRRTRNISACQPQRRGWSTRHARLVSGSSPWAQPSFARWKPSATTPV